MQSQKSQPVHVAALPATELGGSGKNSIGGLYVLTAATILPSSTSRYPLGLPAIVKNRKRPWDKMTTDTMHEELQSATDYLPIVSVQPVAAEPALRFRLRLRMPWPLFTFGTRESKEFSAFTKVVLLIY